MTIYLLCGKNPRDYYSYIKLDNVTRYFFDNGKFVDVLGDLEDTAENFEKELGVEKQMFLKYFKRWKIFIKYQKKFF